MSGFFCAIDRSGAPLDRARCEARLTAIEDIGPDGKGLRWPRPSIVLAHSKRNDTPEAIGAALPLERNGCLLVADIRLDNRDEVIDRLAQRDTAQPDSELLMDAYLAWGRDCVSRLTGEFSAAIWDGRENRLFCARDPMGDRAFYYATAGATFVCSSELRVVRTWEGVSPEVDELVVARALVRRGLFMRDGSRTFFRAVRQLPPGHTLTLANSDLHTSSYWSIHDLAATPLPAASLDEHHEDFRSRLRTAVASRLRSARPVGSHLSGGLDSTSIACIAASKLQGSNQQLHCFSHVARRSIGDVSPTRSVREESFVEAAARQYPNTVLHWVSGEERELLGGLEAQFHYIGLAHPNHYQTWWDGITLQARQHEVGTLLTGVSGNLTASFTGLPSGGTLRRWVGRVLRRGGYRRVKWEHGSALRSDVAERLNIDDQIAENAGTTDRASALGRGMNGLYRAYSIGRFGVELRDPMADRRIVEFCLRAPQALFRRDGWSRRLIRDSLRGIVPDIVLDRRSRQLQGADWIERTLAARQRMQALVDDLSGCELASGYVDWSIVRARLERVPLARGDMFALVGWNNGVLGAIAVGRFLKWVEDGCSPPAQTPYDDGV